MTEVVMVPSQAAGVDAREVGSGFEVYDSEFVAALGPAPRLALVPETDAHEGPVCIPGEDVPYFTSLPRKSRYPRTWDPGCIRQSARSGRSQLSGGSLAAVGRTRRLCICPTGCRLAVTGAWWQPAAAAG
jgi:hypothetical protein